MAKYFLFGAGEYGKRAVSLVDRKNIGLIIDNDPLKWNTKVEGIRITNIDEAKSLLTGECVIISVSPEKSDAIIEQLNKNNITNYIKYEEILRQITKERILSRVDYIGIYNKAISWVVDNSIDGGGVICSTNLPKSYPEVTGYFIPSLLKWGYRKLACSYARWLCSIQKEDGSWYNTEDTEPYIFDTAQVLKGLLAIRMIIPEVDPHILAGCEWIFEQMQEDGRLITPAKDDWGTDINICDEVIHIYCLSPLLEAAEIFDKPIYKKNALCIWEYYRQNYYDKIMDFSLLSHFYAYLMEALLDINELDMAKEAMHKMEAYQKESGAVPAFRDHDWVCSTGLFQLSMVWFRLGDIDRGNRAFEYACKLQNESGGWFGSYLSEDNPMENNIYFPTSEISWAVKFFLDALYYKNVAEFEKSKDSFLSCIDKGDDRYQIICQQLSSLKKEGGNKVLDLGCGKGRYLKRLVEDMPDNHYVAVDLSEGVMDFFTENIAKKKQGSLTNIPYDDDYFDMVYACESLEHAVDIKNAVREMGRVTRSGGKIMIIDKNLKALGALEITPWEQWFDEDDLKKIMECYCTNVLLYNDISYDGKNPDGLFCIWVGEIK